MKNSKNILLATRLDPHHLSHLLRTTARPTPPKEPQGTPQTHQEPFTTSYTTYETLQSGLQHSGSRSSRPRSANKATTPGQHIRTTLNPIISEGWG
ncbi:hypothetical protein E2C01_085819 [Portunus trituberculatus]|uniref:Uncharacterized protein n=1 Tax=Portunus trituberculatus TaxID=210409 RepID=A0A5B7JBQ1_PORTR|nr:hypothetical protein [Portunus trituberculatus]